MILYNTECLACSQEPTDSQLSAGLPRLSWKKAVELM